MEFEVKRTSWSVCLESPCKEAKLGESDTNLCWVVEIESMDDLITFIERNENEIVVTKAETNNSLPVIEIYDTYRE